METNGKLRRRHLVKGENVSAIARDLNLSRNTVKKYLKAESEPVYRRERQPHPKLRAFQEKLENWLARDTFTPLAFPPGDTCQLDWSHEQVELSGVMQTVKAAHRNR